MRKYIIALVSVTIFIGSSYAVYASITWSDKDDLVATLPGYSLIPLNPPTSGTPGLGVLYFIKPDLRRVDTICEPPKELVAKYISIIGSANVRGRIDHQATYSSMVNGVIGKMTGGNGSFDDSRSDSLNYEFSDVRLYKIEIGAALKLYEKIMERDDCKSAVVQYQNVPGYICQGLQVFEATGSLWFDSQDGKAASLNGNAKKALVESKITGGTNVGLVEHNGKYTTGKALQWGIEMTPICLTPPRARSLHTLPQTKWERIQNFIQYNIVERIFPAA
ncbi:MAG TPA: hypothetical protein VIH87_00775 [Methylocella sp.]